MIRALASSNNSLMRLLPQKWSLSLGFNNPNNTFMPQQICHRQTFQKFSKSWKLLSSTFIRIYYLDLQFAIFRFCHCHLPRVGGAGIASVSGSLFSQGCSQAECAHARYFSADECNVFAHRLVKVYLEISVIADSNPSFHRFFAKFHVFPRLLTSWVCPGVLLHTGFGECYYKSSAVFLINQHEVWLL